MTVGHALEDVPEPGKGLDVVKLCGGDEGADGCPSDAATVRAREQMVFTPERDGPDGALDRIVVQPPAGAADPVRHGGRYFSSPRPELAPVPLRRGSKGHLSTRVTLRDVFGKNPD
ncbi:MAG: hypothetical protein QOE55_5300 [Acidobacteriaceae bacterium]|jgi:hypothetical protein|nr:hypothetical protein [Acidobacteriaceae bacterium]